MNRSSRVVVTCAAEAEWNRLAGVRAPIEALDLTSAFELEGGASKVGRRADGECHVLFIGRAADPLKGVRYLKQAVANLNSTPNPYLLRVVSNHFGAELEADWEWCDVLCLPTLSENFGLVIAEALERGKRVVTTDGASAWADYFAAHPDRGTCIAGYRDGTDAFRIQSLSAAFQSLTSSCQNSLHLKPGVSRILTSRSASQSDKLRLRRSFVSVMAVTDAAVHGSSLASSAPRPAWRPDARNLGKELLTPFVNVVSHNRCT